MRTDNIGNTLAPYWEHDCEKCEFLGGMVLTSARFDLYVCAKHPENPDPMDSIIARYGSDGPDYHSTPPSLTDIGHPALAVTRAVYFDRRGIEASGGSLRRWIRFRNGHVLYF